MSLINDALRRAQQEQHKATPVALADHGLQMLRPVEPRPSGGGAKWILVLLVLFLVAAAGVFLWMGTRLSATPTAHVEPNLEQTQPSAATPPPPVAVQADPVVNPAPAVAPPAVVAPPVQINTVTVVVTNFVEAAAPAANLSPASPPPPAPIFPTLKLQGIFYRPSNPSVMVNGQTLFLNDEVEKARVVAITQNSVTVVWSGQTNVMTLR